MFGEMRAALGITKSEDILEHIYALPTPEQQHQAMEAVRAIERTAMGAQVAQPGLEKLMAYLDSRAVRKGIVSHASEARASLAVLRPRELNFIAGKLLTQAVVASPRSALATSICPSTTF
jgi:hypothetical protein